METTTENTNMPFAIKDCALIPRMVGIGRAMNLRELQERIQVAPVESLFHHFCETVIRPTFDDPEFRNDLAVWASHSLRDRVLAERLGIINPYALNDFEELRWIVQDILEERLAELPHIPWAPRGDEFRFMQAVTVVFDTGKKLEQPADLVRELPHMSLGSVYYHFVEARRRTESKTDDFRAWLADFNEHTKKLCEALKSIDFYFLALPELKQALINKTRQISVETAHG
jgi:hypothetical protein